MVLSKIDPVDSAFPNASQQNNNMQNSHSEIKSSANTPAAISGMNKRNPFKYLNQSKIRNSDKVAATISPES